MVSFAKAPWSLLPIGVVLCLLLAIYWPGLHGGFLFDDSANILLAEGVKMERLEWSEVLSALRSGHAGWLGRPVAQLSFALNYWYSGFDAFAFKLTNLFLHALNAVLVYLFVRVGIAGTLFPQGDGRRFAFSVWIAVIWLFHPIQLTSVLLVVQRMTILATGGVLAALLLHIRARDSDSLRGRWLGLALAWVGGWPLAVLAKESAFLFPLFVLTWELCVRRVQIGGLDVFARILLGVALLGGLGATVYATSDSGAWLFAGYDFRAFSLLERLLTEARILWSYIGLIIWPRLEELGLYHDDVLISSGFFSPPSSFFALAAALAAFALVLSCRHRFPLTLFGGIWFLVGHLLESTFLPLELMHEHRNYLPSLGLFVAMAELLWHLGTVHGIRRTIATSLAVAALVYPMGVTAVRSHQFGDDVRRTQIEAQHHRTSARAQYEAGLVLSRFAERAEPDSPVFSYANRHFELAMELDPLFKLGGLGTIYLNCVRQQPTENGFLSDLAARFRTTPFLPGDTAFFYGLKEILLAKSECLTRKQVEILYEGVFANKKITPFYEASLYSWFSDYLWLSQHDLVAAKIASKHALELHPGKVAYRLQWAQLLWLSSEEERRTAIRILRDLETENLSNFERQLVHNLLKY